MERIGVYRLGLFKNHVIKKNGDKYYNFFQTLRFLYQ